MRLFIGPIYLSYVTIHIFHGRYFDFVFDFVIVDLNPHIRDEDTDAQKIKSFSQGSYARISYLSRPICEVHLCDHQLNLKTCTHKIFAEIGLALTLGG